MRFFFEEPNDIFRRHMAFDDIVAEKRRVASGELRGNTRLRPALVEIGFIDQGHEESIGFCNHHLRGDWPPVPFQRRPFDKRVMGWLNRHPPPSSPSPLGTDVLVGIRLGL
jgi:hypothetical protein